MKSLLIFLLLLIWFAFGSSFSCLGFSFFLLLSTTLLTLSLSEITLIKKETFAETLFQKKSTLFGVFRSRYLTLFLSLLVAFSASSILLLTLLNISSFLFALLALDIFVLWFIYAKMKKRLAQTLQEKFIDPIAREWSVWINTLFLTSLFIVYQFFTPPTLNIENSQCEIVNFLLSITYYKDILEWRVMSASMSGLDYWSGVFVWLGFLLISQGVVTWSYSRLLVSVEQKISHSNNFLIGFIGAIFLLLSVSLLINHLYESKMHTQLEVKYRSLQKSIDTTLNSGEQKIIKDIDKIIEEEIERNFVGVYDGIPSLSEYYYSLKGEYTRLALKGSDIYCEYKNSTLLPYYNQYLSDEYKLKKCNEEKLDHEIEAKVQKFLFTQNGFDAQMRVSAERINKQIVENLQATQSELQKSIEDINISNTNELSRNFDLIFSASSRDVAKKGLSGGGAILLTSTISKTVLSKILLKLGAKGAGKAASFVAGSLTGLSICAPSGPWAFLCGVVTGTASWIGVDAAMTEIDQAFNEEDFKLSVKEMIDVEKETLKTLMKESYSRWILEIFEKLHKSSESLKSPYEQIEKREF